MNIKPIKTEADYKDTLKKLEAIFDAAIGTPESDEADVLGLMNMKRNIIQLKHQIQSKQLKLEWKRCI
jgi:antitoxin component HigA of HigAB toxin-antitoxin module